MLLLSEKKKQTKRDKFEYVRYAVIGHKFLVPAFRVVVACSKRSDSGETVSYTHLTLPTSDLV